MKVLSLLSCLCALNISCVAFADQAPKAIASTEVITSDTPGHATKIEADIKGAKDLYLVVTDGGNGYGSDWADWAEPRLVGSKRELKLTDLKWKSAESDWGKVGINVNADGGSMRIQGKPVEYGIGTHANSVIHYELPEGYDKFVARAGLDNGGSDQGGGTSVQFYVYTQAPPAAPGSPTNDRTPEGAVAGLDVTEGVELKLFAAEPMLLSPSNIDIDHMGRIWVCEVVNYRRFANGGNPDRPEGDRILVLEDTNGDGMADKETVFYQGRDIDSAHGVCVLGNRVIVSAGDSVFNFYDDNGDLKADRKEVMFTGIKGTQHDHGIHSFQFGPDGRLYFNFGNAGEELHNPDGSIVIDVAGNEVRAARKPYQEGMAFRCELDGSKVDTLGWNFRNNWELCVDSFGTVWQSDNDDDGNKGVRINFVMEYGNYGYKDELTGAGWQTPRTNMEEEIPDRHWHLNDPGVVPNLLQTGAGSPTGILIYEGDKMPERFVNQLIHCDAGPNVVRSYAVTDDGAGYKAEINNILNGTRDQWFRPSDVCVAPDGSLIVADWYDPGVGGHRQGDVERGRLFRVSMPGQKYSVPKHDFSTVEGAVEALKSPNNATRYLAFQMLKESGTAAETMLAKMFTSDPNPRFRARALWLLGQIDGREERYVNVAVVDKDKDIRIAGIRLARLNGTHLPSVVNKLTSDPSPQVIRDCAIALRHDVSLEKPNLWAQLAARYVGYSEVNLEADTKSEVIADRWLNEALGLSADLPANTAWRDGLNMLNVQIAAETSQLVDELKKNGSLPDKGDEKLSKAKAAMLPPASRVLELHLRSRHDGAPKRFAEIIRGIGGGNLVPREVVDSQLLQLFRSMDFQPRSFVQDSLQTLLSRQTLQSLRPEHKTLIVAEVLQRLEKSNLASNPDARFALDATLSEWEGTARFVQIVRRLELIDQFAALLAIAQSKPSEQLGIEAISALLELKQWEMLGKALTGADTAAAIATAEVMGNSANGAINGPLLSVVKNADINIDVRRAAVKATSKVNNGATELVKLVDEKTLDPELTQAVAAALHSAPSRQAREQAQRLFPLPPSKDNMPTLPITELVKLQGDLPNGRIVFFSTGTCHKCHVVDGMGREIGPNLSEIGSKLSREAMFESVLYPSAGISHNFEAWTAVLTSGTTINGVLISNTDEEVSIKSEDALVRVIKKSEIEELVKQTISMMPADLQKTMTTQELADVTEYMLSLKKK